MKISPVLIDGHHSDGRIAVTDSSVLRGDGCFEVLRAYQGIPFGLEGHLERLQRSAARLGIPLPDSAEIGQWINQVAAPLGDCAVRVVVTRGSAIPGLDDPPHVIVFAHEWNADGGPTRLYPVAAPWHAAGVEWDLAGAKILSYAPNLSATRHARQAGFDDALLISGAEVVLEGPTFSVAWVVEGVLETPSLDLGILDSITRRVVLQAARRLGWDVVEGAWGLDRLAEASEVMALSTIREVQACSAVGDMAFDEGPVTKRLAADFAGMVR